MYRHFIMRKLKNYAKFTELKSARQTQLKILTARVAAAPDADRAELENLLAERKGRYYRCEKERKRMEMHLRSLCDEDRQLLSDFYIERKRDRYSKYYAQCGDELENVKNQALDNLSEIYFESRKRKRHSD